MDRRTHLRVSPARVAVVCLGVTCLAVLAISCFRGAVADNGRFLIVIARGGVLYHQIYDAYHGNWYFASFEPDGPVRLRPYINSDSESIGVFVPLWIPMIVAAGLTAWIASSRRWNALTAACKKCGYDCTGVPVGAVCPECGKARTQPTNSR